jgi:hypothetical protein
MRSGVVQDFTEAARVVIAFHCAQVYYLRIFLCTNFPVVFIYNRQYYC